MKMMKYVLAGWIVLLSSTAMAQDDHKNSRIDQLHEQKWQILITRADLTPKETDLVKPVFMEYEQTIWRLHQENREFFKAAIKNAKNVKPDYAELNDRYINSEFKEAQLFKNYHLKLRTLLQPETLFKYYKAERDFKRKLLQDLQDRKAQNKHD